MTRIEPARAGAAILLGDAGDAATPIADDQAAVLALEAPAVRVTAPAGSGKTRTMVEWAVDRAARLDPAGDRSVLAVTFTVRATGELQARVAAALRRRRLPAGLVRVATLHGFAASVIAEHGHHLGVPADARLIGDADQHAVVEAALDGADFTEADATWLPGVVGDVAELASALADHGVDPADAAAWHRDLLARYEEHRDAVEAFELKKDRKCCDDARAAAGARLDLLDGVRRFRERKHVQGVLDHGDQLQWAGQLLAVPEVVADLRRRHPFVVVDEYQDTNVAQRVLLQRLHDPDGGQLVAVGDDAQAIYGFRGATLDNFDRFADHFPGAAEASLHNVYRHGPQVVAAAEAVAARAGRWRQRRTTAAGSSSVRVLSFPDQMTESQWIADHVSGLLDRGAAGRDIAVLAGQRRVLLPVARLLEAGGVPVEAPGLGGLLDSPAFHDVLATLRLAHDPGNAVAATRLLRGPRYRLGPHHLAPFVEAAEALAGGERRAAGLDWRDDVGVRLVDGLLQPGATADAQVRSRADRFLDDVRRWVSRARMLPLAAFAEEAVADLGLDEALATSPSPLAVRARSELAATLDEVRAYEAVDPRGGLGGFLSWIDRRLEADEQIDVAGPDPRSPAVRLLTIHAAKGLQFRHVVVAGVADKTLPNTALSGCETTASGRSVVPDGLRGDGERASPELWDPDAVRTHEARRRSEIDDEQRRLFYVAATRAAESLAVTASVWGWSTDFSALQKQRPSPYLDDLEAAGFSIERPAGDPPGVNPLEPLPTIEPPAPAAVAPLERAAISGGAALDEAAAGAGAAPVALDRIRALAADLLAREPHPQPPAPPAEHTVTDLVLASRCPVAYSRRRVLGLPQPVSTAARRGTLVHRWIEERAWALQDGRDPEAVPRPWRVPNAATASPAAGGGAPARAVVDADAGSEAPPDDPPEAVATGAEADDAADRFLHGPYGRRVPWAVELPVVLTVGGAHVRGTVDAVHGDAPSWEIVDVKTGPAPDDDAGWLQLEAYALAVSDSEGWPLDACTLTFVSLAAADGVVSRPAPGRDTIVDRLGAALARTAGPYDCAGCRHCR